MSESCKEPEPVLQCQVSLKLQLALQLHLLSLLQSAALLVCSLDASPCASAVVLYYYTFKVLYCKILNIFLFLCVCFFMYYLCKEMKVKESEVAQSYLTLCDPMDCSLPGSSIHWIFQARVLEPVAISFSRGSS